ncbi:CAP domain-containing protein [Shivajiella indica]|uniref:CAP domain-containing protein n=1 Tax=Shivajiella indica TaxID=872115 RepID=A0ABW5B557_9BACT
MNITQLLKKQVCFWALLMSIALNSCIEHPKIQELPEKEVRSVLLDFNKELLLLHLNQLRIQGCQCGNVSMAPVPPVVWNSLLASAAQKHSEDMFANNFFLHIGSDQSTLKNRVDNTGYLWKLLGENIARGNFNEESLIKAWKNSPDHCKQMMDADFLETGVGKKDIYWTMVLAK